MPSTISHSAGLLTNIAFSIDCNEHKLLRKICPWMQSYHCLRVQDLIRFPLGEAGKETDQRGQSAKSSGTETLANFLRRSDLPEIWATLRVDHDRPKREFVIFMQLNKEFCLGAIADLPQCCLELKGRITASYLQEDRRGHPYRTDIVFMERYKVPLYLTENSKVDIARFSMHHPIFQYLRNFETRLQFILDVGIRWSDSIPIKMDNGFILNQLFESDASKDVTILVEGDARVKCHRLILEASSPVLAAMVSPANGMVESQTGQITLSENSEKGIALLVQYLYGKEVVASDLDCDTALELFQAAHLYQLTQLETAVGQLIRQKSVSWFSADVAVTLYFFVRNLDLEEFMALTQHLIVVMTKMPEEIRSCQRFTELEPAEAQDLLWRLFATLR